jgi:multidrug resistance efflux pump
MKTENEQVSQASELSPPNWRRRGLFVGAILAVLCVAGSMAMRRGPASAAGPGETGSGDWITVKRDIFEILCREDGELRPAKVTTVTFLNWGKIAYIIPEGTFVKKGEKLVALETKDQEDHIQEHVEDLASAERDMAQREQNRDLEIRRLTADIASEKERVALAALREKELLAKPLPLDREEAVNLLEGAKARLANAKAELEAYKPLAEKGFATGFEMASKQLAVTRAEVELERAEMRCRLTLAGAKPEEREKAKLNREHAELALKIKEIDYENQVDVLTSKVKAVERVVNHNKRRLVRHRDDLERSTIYAPHEGIVVYRIMEFRGNKKVEVGDQVGPWLSPMDLPRFEWMKVRTQVPESFIRLIKARYPPARTPGVGEGQQPGPLNGAADSADSAGRNGADASAPAGPVTPGTKARVMVKTLPDRIYPAEVTWVDGWARDRNSKLSEADIKAQGLSGVRVFDVEVSLLESDPQRLREGFRATVEIPVEVHKDLISVPIAAVTYRESDPHVRVRSNGRAEWRKVTLGMQSIDRVVITEGLAEGELVFAPRATPPPRHEKTPEETKDDAGQTKSGTPARRSAGRSSSSDAPVQFSVPPSVPDTTAGARRSMDGGERSSTPGGTERGPGSKGGGRRKGGGPR